MINSKEDIKLRFPKTCNHCPAFIGGGLGGWQACSLGYKTVNNEENRLWKKFTPYEDLFVRIKPAEPCPRPKNRAECVDIRGVVDVHRYYRVGSPEYEEECKDSRIMTEEENHYYYINSNKK